MSDALYYTATEVADLFGVHKNTVRNMLKDGRLHAVKTKAHTGHFRFNKEEVHELLARTSPSTIDSVSEYESVMESVTMGIVLDIENGEIEDEEGFKKELEKQTKRIVSILSYNAQFDISKEYEEDENLNMFLNGQELAAIGDWSMRDIVERYVEIRTLDLLELSVWEQIQKQVIQDGLPPVEKLVDVWTQVKTCGHCGKTFNAALENHLEAENHADAIDVCSDCVENYRACADCGEYFAPEGRGRKCPSCRD